MDENNEIEKDNIKSTLLNENEKEKENNEKINEEILIKENSNNNINTENAILPENDKEKGYIINTNINTNTYNDNQNKNETFDHLITIKYSKIFRIPYFIFGGVFHFYFPCKSFPSNPIKLSEMPTPPFAVIRSECNYIYNI